MVNLSALAKRVEAAHFPDPIASCDPPTTSGESVNTPNPCFIIYFVDLSYIPSVASYDLSHKSEFSNDVRQQLFTTFIHSCQSSLSGKFTWSKSH